MAKKRAPARKPRNRDEFLALLQAKAATFAKAVATNEGAWIVKGFIDIYRRIYTVSVDTKIVSKVLELLMFPMFVDFAQEHSLGLELAPHQNFHPDLTFIEEETAVKFAVDIKSTYRVDEKRVNGMTLGAFTGYFRNRDSSKNTLYPYNQYSGHFALGAIYSKTEETLDERRCYTLEDLEKIPSVIRNFEFFAQPKYRIASDRPGSGNTKNIGSVTNIAALLAGNGPFASLGEEVYDDYWMYYLTKDMAQALGIPRPYRNLKSYAEYKKRGIEAIKAHEQEIEKLAESDQSSVEQEEEENSPPSNVRASRQTWLVPFGRCTRGKLTAGGSSPSAAPVSYRSMFDPNGLCFVIPTSILFASIRISSPGKSPLISFVTFSLSRGHACDAAAKISITRSEMDSIRPRTLLPSSS